MFQLSRNDDVEEPVINVDTAALIVPVIRSHPAGRWRIDELQVKPFPTGHTSRCWGVAIKRADGSVVIKRAGGSVMLEPNPWPLEPPRSCSSDRRDSD
jgi:hypothetical protein